MAEVTTILCPICHKSNLRRARFCQHCGRDVVLNNDGPRFYIIRVLKEGGQGAVYETVGDDERVYAVKEMLDRSTDPKERAEALERFETEAHMLQRLSHPRIPRVYADFKDEGRNYLAMDFVHGEDLEEVLRREGALPERRVLEWADQICDVLDYLHRNGLIYRDMKPSNVMIERQNGGVKLVDFGIAKVFQHAQRGTQIGTPGYAPPEQYQGIATPESDIYALGATLHHMLTGRDPRDEPPFSFPIVYALKPSVSRRTSDAILRALQMKPEDRYRSVAEFRAALRPAPVQPPQVRVAPKTQALPAQPQVASAPAQPTAASGRPQAVAQARPPATQQRVQPAAAPQVAARPAGAVARPQAAQQPRKRSFFRTCLTTLLIMLVLAGGAFFVVESGLANQYIPGLLSSPSPTPQTFIQEMFTADDMEVIVPSGGDVRAAFIEAFKQKAREYGGPGTIINANAPPTFLGGEPQNLGDDPRGTRYRASMQGFIQVPQQP